MTNRFEENGKSKGDESEENSIKVNWKRKKCRWVKLGTVINTTEYGVTKTQIPDIEQTDRLKN